MSTIVTGPEVSSQQEGPPRKQWTRSECALLEESGLWDGQHFELIDGELYNKMGKKRPHVIALTLIRNWLSQRFGGQFIDTEASIDVAPEDNPTNEPEPDLIVLARSSFEFTANPTPADIRLAVEISDTTFWFDSTRKARLYARAGIAEYWVIKVTERSLIVHRNPVNGSYQSIVKYSGQEPVASGAVTNPFLANDLFHQ
jgi:Uma2 family endonuclease